MTDYEPMDAEQLDAAARGVRDYARVVRAFYEGLVESGFSESDALRLTGESLKKS